MNRPLVMIWWAIAFSQVVYLFVPAPPREAAGEPGALPLALGVVALAEGAFVVALLRVRAFKPIREGRLDPTSGSGAAQLFPTLILAWVLAESVALFGLVLRFLHFELSEWAPFAVGGALLLLLGRPGQAGLQRPESPADHARSNEPIG